MKPVIDPATANRVQKRLCEENGPALVDFIDMHHPLVRLANIMQWEIFDNHWSASHSNKGGPRANSGRRVAVLLLLKHMEALSDQRLMQHWVINPYYQYFCDETHFQHRPPVDPTSLIKWRKWLGEEGMEWLLTTVVESAAHSGVVERSSFAHLCVDSTVMEKNIAHPTDGALLEKMCAKLVTLMMAHDLTLHQSYSRHRPQLAQQVGRYAHAKQFKRMRWSN